MSILIADKPYTPVGAEDDYYGTIRDNMSTTSASLKRHEKRLATAQSSVSTLGDRAARLESVSIVKKGRGYLLFGDGTVMNWGVLTVDDTGANFIKFPYPFIDTNYSVSFGVHSTNSSTATIHSKGNDVCWVQVHAIPKVTVGTRQEGVINNVIITGTPETGYTANLGWRALNIPTVTVTELPLACNVEYVAFGRWKPHEAYDV